MEKSAIIEIQQAANASIKTETGTPSKNESQDERLASAIRKMFKELGPSVSNKCRIYRVPYQLRTLNPEAYTPHVISIGPYHHNNDNCRSMEKHKVRYFENFMDLVKRTGLEMENLVSTIRKMENEIRSCYVETVQLKSDDFVKMIMLDASFILELFLRDSEDSFTDDDPMKVKAWLLEVVRRELLLLENQLPFFVIEKLYHLALPSLPNPTPLIQLTFHFFKGLNIHKKSHTNVEIQHFTDLLRFFQLPPTNKLPERIEKAIFLKYSVTQLHDAGVMVKEASSKCARDEVALSILEEKPSSKCVVPDELASTKCLLDEVASSEQDEDTSKSILDISFKNGVLEIPSLLFDDNTEAFVRNIMALEQCDYISEAYVTDFYVILDNLIDTDEDVELLINEEILDNYLGDNNAVRSLINNLNRGITLQNMNSEFCQLSDALNNHYKKRCSRWRAMLKQQYFSTPWKSAGTVAATILVVLNLIQAVYSILQVVL